MISTTRPLNNAALYTGVHTGTGPIPRAGTPGTSLPATSAQRLAGTSTQAQPQGQKINLVGRSNRRIAAPRTRGGNVAL